VHSITHFDPYSGNFIENQACDVLNGLFHDSITSYFATGNFKWYCPVLSSIEYQNSDAKRSLDFFGINYYSHVLLRVDAQVQNQAYRDDEIRTDMPYCIYPEGMYRSIVDVSKRIAKPQHIPIYITENGIADATDANRELFIKRYIYAMHKAMGEGHDVRGYFYWSLLDNFEWTEGYKMKFGLYEVDFNSQKRTLRNGSKAFLNIVHNTYGSSDIKLPALVSAAA
jgi:beta-glucosidase